MSKTRTPAAEGQMTEVLEKLVADADTGGRKLAGIAGKFLSLVAIGWSLFQFWYASPLPFVLNAGVLNDTETRAIHLGVALFLAFLAYPALKSSSRSSIPVHDWLLACAGAFAGAYMFLFYQELALRPGQPTTVDMVTGALGLLVLLEATRRAVGTPMTILALVFLMYTFAGPFMPEVISHKGASLERAVSHHWLTTEGVYGVALGVSAGYIFIYVLFGSLLDKAGAGNYMMQVSFALLGHLRGGPAKVAVVSSGLNGLISGSSVSNVVSGGIFTIPLMKRTGYGGIKSAAIETVSSVNGQIMPPVMGAAAFLMVEYVGIPYAEIIKHAFLPATISYIALFYIVHLEALKLNLPAVSGKKMQRTAQQKMLAWLMGLAGTLGVCGAVYYVALGVQALFGAAAPWILGPLLAALYVYTVWVSARSPDLPQTIDVNHPVLPDTWPTVKAGLHFLIPIGVLIWCLMIEELSPALSAFWATLILVILMATQRGLIALFRRRGDVMAAFRLGVAEVSDGFELGARNMIGIAIATATAGIIVGTITLTGLGLRMIDFVEAVSMGNVILMLGFTAFVCLVLGMGVPTTANYILVASLMAPVIVELGAQSGLIIPLIAVHLFVFYFGIMGDITPPVGLASFAAAAISGDDAIKIGLQGSVYALRTVVLPFIFIFNPVMLMIDVETWTELGLVVFSSTLASCIFAAVTMNYFRTKCRWYELAALGLATFILFRPDFFMNLVAPKYEDAPVAKLYEAAQHTPANGRLVMVIRGSNVEGREIRKTVAVQLGASGDGAERLARAGLGFANLGDDVTIASVKFGSRAKKSGFEQGWSVETLKLPSARPSEYWLYLPALLLIAGVWWVQGWRREEVGAPSMAAT